VVELGRIVPQVVRRSGLAPRASHRVEAHETTCSQHKVKVEAGAQLIL
jgi:hypothetical protein